MSYVRLEAILPDGNMQIAHELPEVHRQLVRDLFGIVPDDERVQRLTTAATVRLPSGMVSGPTIPMGL